MSRRLQLHPRARSDLAEIWSYTARQWSMTQADTYLHGLRGVLTLLLDQPEIARHHGKADPAVRVHRYRSHIVIFTADDSLLEVIRVVHYRTNWQAQLSS